MNPSMFSIRPQTGGEVSFTETIPDTLTDFLFPGARPIVAICQSGYVLIQEITSQDFSLWHHTVLLTQDEGFQISCDQPLLSLNFCLQNCFSLYSDSTECLDFSEGHYNMSFLPRINLVANFQKDKVHSFLTLFYSPAYLSKIALSYPRLAAFLAKAGRKDEAFLYSSNQFVSKEMKKSILCMLQAGCKEEETSICIKKGRALEILIQALELTTRQPVSYPTGLTRQDAEKIYAAKEWVEEQYGRPITLFELARTVGMNVHKLGSGFLQIIGATVYNYHRKIRMNKAIKLLEETDLSLFDIGIEVGYMDGKSFSKEFKKENSISPFEYRKRIRIQHM